MAMLQGSSATIPSRKPVIKVSAPEKEEAKNDEFSTPRSAPRPPSESAMSVASSRKGKDSTPKKSLGFGFSRKDKDKDKDDGSVASDRERASISRESVKHSRSLDKESVKSRKSLEKMKGSIPMPNPNMSPSPILPPKMAFPVPPGSKAKLHLAGNTQCAAQHGLGLGNGAQIVNTLTDAFQGLSPTASSMATISPHTATASDMSDKALSDGERSPSSPRIGGNGSGIPSRPVRPASLVIPPSSLTRPRANSSNTTCSTLTVQSLQSYHTTSQPPSSPSSPTAASLNRPVPSFPPSSRLRSAHRASRSPSPASPPPRSPLPSPPISMTSFPISSDADAGWSTDASTRLGYGGWSTDASTRVGSLGTPGSRKSSLPPSHLASVRIRANTVTTTNGLSRASVNSASSRMSVGVGSTRHAAARAAVSSGEETPYESATSATSGRVGVLKTAKKEALANSLLAFGHGKHEKDYPRGKTDREKLRVETGIVSGPQPPSPTSQTPHADDANANASSNSNITPTREDHPQALGLRAAHDTFVRILQEKHAAEKAELLKRIERLEREARKREREIKGLRWLVMNATSTSNGEASYAQLLALDEQLSSGRLRSGSKSSQLSGLSLGADSDRSRTSSSGPRSRADHVDDSLASVEGQSIEDSGDLIRELQSAVSDIIAPAQKYTPADIGDERPDSSGSGSDLKRSNMLPDSPSVNAKHARRTSSSILLQGIPSAPSGMTASTMSLASSVDSSRSHGLGFDIPTIPGSSSDMSMTTMVDGDSASGSIPSLTATNTASSTSSLSAIPEIASIPSERDLEIQREKERQEKEERRASKALKRISASSGATASYSSNLKVGMSPSIGQVLDRVNVDEAGMDEVLRKLRAFGSNGGGGAERDS